MTPGQVKLQIVDPVFLFWLGANEFWLGKNDVKRFYSVTDCYFSWLVLHSQGILIYTNASI